MAVAAVHDRLCPLMSVEWGRWRWSNFGGLLRAGRAANSRRRRHCIAGSRILLRLARDVRAAWLDWFCTAAFCMICTAMTCCPAALAASPSLSDTDGRDCVSCGHQFGSLGAVLRSEPRRRDSTAPSVPPGKDARPEPARPRKDAKAPLVRIGNVEASSGIPVEVIRRILRQSYGRYRACYADGLRRDAELRGKVEVRFVIERDGNASNLMDGGSTLPDTSVVRCILNSVGVLAFPKPRGPWLAPDGGTMSVKLEIWLTPG